VTDTRTGATTVGLSGGELNAKMARVLEEQGFDLPALERNLDVEGLKAALRNKAVRDALDPRIADAVVRLPSAKLLGFDPTTGESFLALPWNCAEIQALEARLAAGSAPADTVSYTALAHTHQTETAGRPFLSCLRCEAIHADLSVTNASDTELANATRTGDVTAAAPATETSHTTGASMGLTNVVGKTIGGD
jgi:hypothetical protein